MLDNLVRILFIKVLPKNITEYSVDQGWPRGDFLKSSMILRYDKNSPWVLNKILIQKR